MIISKDIKPPPSMLHGTRHLLTVSEASLSSSLAYLLSLSSSSPLSSGDFGGPVELAFVASRSHRALEDRHRHLRIHRRRKPGAQPVHDELHQAGDVARLHLQRRLFDGDAVSHGDGAQDEVHR